MFIQVKVNNLEEFKKVVEHFDTFGYHYPDRIGAPDDNYFIEGDVYAKLNDYNGLFPGCIWASWWNQSDIADTAYGSVEDFIKEFEG